MKKHMMLLALLAGNALNAAEALTKEQYLELQNKNKTKLLSSWNSLEQKAKLKEKHEAMLKQAQKHLEESLQVKAREHQKALEQELDNLNHMWNLSKDKKIDDFINESLNTFLTPKPKRKNGSYRDGSEPLDEQKMDLQIRALQSFIKNQNLKSHHQSSLLSYISVQQRAILQINSQNGTFSEDDETTFLGKSHSAKLSRKKALSVDEPAIENRKLRPSLSFLSFLLKKKK